LDHPDTLISVNNLAGALYAQGRLKEAEELHRRALKVRKARLGLHHPDTLGSMNNLAYALRAQGRHSEAEDAASLYRRALTQVARGEAGMEHPNMLSRAN
jgi:Flp pilus assembly protein TadD